MNNIQYQVILVLVVVPAPYDATRVGKMKQAIYIQIQFNVTQFHIENEPNRICETVKMTVYASATGCEIGSFSMRNSVSYFYFVANYNYKLKMSKYYI